MPNNSNNCPFASSFKSAINRGTPCWTAICNIASKCNKTPQAVCQSLFKAELVDRCKFNGQWLYWPCCSYKTTATAAKNCQFNMWQHFVEWCMASGCCTPEQLSNCNSSQKAFMTFCRKFWNQQFSGAMNASTSTKKRASTSAKSKMKRSTATKSYKFPQTSRRSRQIAA